jgi:hypothetical protein
MASAIEEVVLVGFRFLPLALGQFREVDGIIGGALILPELDQALDIFQAT